MSLNKLNIQVGGFDATATLTVEDLKEIILMVPGTSDPVNTDKDLHGAYNKTYFEKNRQNKFLPKKEASRNNLNFFDKDSFLGKEESFIGPVLPTNDGTKLNFLESLREINKKEFPDLFIEDKWFSWSGDNRPEEREKAGKDLMDRLIKDFPGNKNKNFWIHLVGHSHGGNVINEFTKQITANTDFPEKWKIKSITYLSTPFFNTMHQVDETKFHENCKIINVYNEYDLTQRFVADYSVHELATYLDAVIESDDAIDAKLYFKLVDKEVFKTLKEAYPSYDDLEKLWSNALNLFKGLDLILKVLIENIGKSSAKNITKFNELLSNIKKWTEEAYKDLEIGFDFIGDDEKARENLKWYQPDIKGKVPYRWTYNFISDANLSTEPLEWLNTLLNIKTGANDSFLFGILEEILLDNQNGIIKVIDDTANSPKSQLKKYANKILDVNITKDDLYDTRGKYNVYNDFVTKLEDLVKQGNPSGKEQSNIKDILFFLIAQLDTENSAEKAFTIVKNINVGINVAKLSPIIGAGSLFIDVDEQIAILSKNLKVYNENFKVNNYNLVSQNDIKNNYYGLMEKPGSIGYLAMVAHSLSHMLMKDEVKNELKNNFGSRRVKQ